MTGNRERSRTVMGVESAFRRVLLCAPFYGKSRLILLNEYPKSGGTWVGQMLSAYLSVPFPRHQFPVQVPCIMHGHYLTHYKAPKKIVLWRDPRDIAISWYNHCVFPSEGVHPTLISSTRASLKFSDYEDVGRNLAAFIEFTFLRQRTPGFNWNQFFDRWHNAQDAVHTSYERFRANPVEELLQLAAALGEKQNLRRAQEIVERFSFNRITGRKPGEERRGKLLRNAMVGDWIRYFTIDSARILDNYVGDRLIRGGFESDINWLRRLESSPINRSESDSKDAFGNK